jgi:hypothetical protein
VTASKRRRLTRNTESADNEHALQFSTIEGSAQNSSPVQEIGSPSASTKQPSRRSAATQQSSATPATSNSLPQPRVPDIQNDAVITLEFLSHGRQSILRIGDATLRKQSDWARSPAAMATADGGGAWDLIFTSEQATLLLAYHQDTLAWMHNGKLSERLCMHLSAD